MIHDSAVEMEVMIKPFCVCTMSCVLGNFVTLALQSSDIIFAKPNNEIAMLYIAYEIYHFDSSHKDKFTKSVLNTPYCLSYER